MKDIEAACQAIWGGAKMYVASDVPFFATKHGRNIKACTPSWVQFVA